MDTRPKLIVLNRFAGSGKTTLSQRYINDHPLALAIEGDEIIVHIGAWQKHEDEARRLIFEHTKAMTRAHLSAGYSVVLPYLLTNKMHADAFRDIANGNESMYLEVFIFDEKQAAVDRLMQRGRWGEKGLDPLTEADLPVIEDLYDRMLAASEHRHMSIIRPTRGDVDDAYRQLLSIVEER